MIDPLNCVHFLWDVRSEQGGVVQAATDMCGALAGRGHDIALMTTDPTDVPAAWRDQGPGLPRVVEVDPSRLPGCCLSRKGLKQAWPVLSRANVVHLHTPWVIANAQLARRLRGAGIPFVVTIHGMLDVWSMAQKSTKKRTFLALGGRRFLESATRVHFTAAAEKEQSLRWIPAAASRASVVPNIVDLPAFDKLPGPQLARDAFPGIGTEKPQILFLSRLHPKKGVELLFEAAALLQQRGVEFQLLVAGPGEPAYCESLARLAAERGLAEHVRFLGMVHGAVKLSLYQLADVFVLPTQQENFGLVLVEALMCDTPVVTTRGTDIWQELEQAEVAVVPRTAEAISGAVENILAEPDHGKGRGQRGREYVSGWLQTDRIVRQYEQLYADAIAAANVTAPGKD